MKNGMTIGSTQRFALELVTVHSSFGDSTAMKGAGFGGKDTLPPRMQQSLRRHVIYLELNKDGKRSVVIRHIRHIVKEFEKTETKTKVDRGTEYWIKIENHPAGYRFFLTDNARSSSLG